MRLSFLNVAKSSFFQRKNLILLLLLLFQGDEGRPILLDSLETWRFDSMFGSRLYIISLCSSVLLFTFFKALKSSSSLKDFGFMTGGSETRRQYFKCPI